MGGGSAPTTAVANNKNAPKEGAPDDVKLVKKDNDPAPAAVEAAAPAPVSLPSRPSAPVAALLERQPPASASASASASAPASAPPVPASQGGEQPSAAVPAVAPGKQEGVVLAQAATDDDVFTIWCLVAAAVAGLIWSVVPACVYFERPAGAMFVCTLYIGAWTALVAMNDEHVKRCLLRVALGQSPSFGVSGVAPVSRFLTYAPTFASPCAELVQRRAAQVRTECGVDLVTEMPVPAFSAGKIVDGMITSSLLGGAAHVRNLRATNLAARLDIRSEYWQVQVDATNCLIVLDVPGRLTFRAGAECAVNLANLRAAFKCHSVDTGVQATPLEQLTSAHVEVLLKWIFGAAAKLRHYDFSNVRLQLRANGKIGRPTTEPVSRSLATPPKQQRLLGLLVTLPIGCDTTEDEFLAYFASTT